MVVIKILQMTHVNKKRKLDAVIDANTVLKTHVGISHNNKILWTGEQERKEWVQRELNTIKNLGDFNKTDGVELYLHHLYEHLSELNAHNKIDKVPSDFWNNNLSK